MPRRHSKSGLWLVSVLLLIFLIAIHGTSGSSGGSSEGSTLPSASGLVTDDATCGGPEQTAGRRTTLGVRSGGSRAIRKGQGHNGGAEG